MLQGVWRLRDQFTEACPSNHSLTTICWGPFYSEPYTKKCILEWKCWRQIESHVGTDTRITRSFFLLIKLPLLWCRGKSSCSWENGLLSFPILPFDSIFYFFSGKKMGSWTWKLRLWDIVNGCRDQRLECYMWLQHRHLAPHPETLNIFHWYNPKLISISLYS